MRITEQDITNWAETAECRYTLPVLCRKLVVETTPRLVSFDFPSDTAVDLRGYDGLTDNLEKTAWISEGESYWEISCEKDPRNKAEKDFKKRTSQLSSKEKKMSSFVFVTTRRWGLKSKDKWIREKNKTKEWKYVKAIDASGLASWLDYAYSTNLWLNDLLGKSTQGLYSPDEWWSDWNSKLKYPISSTLVSTRQLNESKTLIDRIQRGDSAISIKANNIDEAIAFVIASFREYSLPNLLDRTIVVTQSELEIKFSQQVPLIVLCKEDNTPKIRGSSNHIIVRAYDNRRIDERNLLKLTYVPRDVFQKELKKTKIKSEEAERIASKSGYSIPVLRRILSKDIEATKPNWARDPKIVQELVPYVFCGHWLERAKNKDKEILEKLGDIDTKSCQEQLEKFLKMEDSPFVKIKDQIILISQIDTLTEIGFAINRDQLERYFEIFYKLFSVKDAEIEHYEGQGGKKEFPEEEKDYSSMILKGFCNTFCILSIHGNTILDKNLKLFVSQKIDEVAKNLLNEFDSNQLFNFRKYFSIISEAVPEVFLNFIENNLNLNESSIVKLLDPAGKDYFGKDNFRQNLLSSLERLAWLSPYFKKVTNILFKLHKLLDQGDKESSIQAEINSLFRVWLPSTILNVEDRFKELHKNKELNRNSVMNVCISLLPKSMGSGVRTSLPKWRILERAVTTGTAKERLTSHRLAKQLLIEMAPYSTNELKKFLEILLELGEELIDKLVREVEEWAKSATEYDKSSLSDSLRRSRVAIIYSKIDSEHSIWVKLQKLEKILTPESPIFKHLWLFGNSHIDWHLLNDVGVEEKYNFREYGEKRGKMRHNAIQEIEEVQGIKGLMKLLLNVEQPVYVADALLPIQESPKIRATWIKRALTNKKSASLKGFVSQALKNTDKNDLSHTIKLLEEDKSISRKKFNLLAKLLPETPESWKLVKKFGIDFENSYWENVSIYPDPDINQRNLKFAVQQLINANRPDQAFSIAIPVKEKLPAKKWIEILEKFAELEPKKVEYPESYYLEQVFEILDKDPSIDDSKISELEYPFLTSLLSMGLQDDRLTAWEKMMSSNPETLIQVLKWYYRSDENSENKDQDTISIANSASQIRNGLFLLQSWKKIPGINENGKIDKPQFNNWIQKAYELTNQDNLVLEFEQHLSILFANFAKQNSQKDWLPGEILDLLERSESESLRKEFCNAVDSVRGGTSRLVFEGGGQELELAQKYWKLEQKYRVDYPNVSKILEKLADLYELEAKTEDNRAETRERWGVY